LTIAAYEVFGVEGLAQSLNNLAQDWLAALGASATGGWTSTVNIVHLTGEIGQQVVKIVTCQGFGPTCRFRTSGPGGCSNPATAVAGILGNRRLRNARIAGRWL